MDKTPPFPFPWTQDDGLAAILDDHDLWARALSFGHSSTRGHEIRRLVKLFLKKLRPGRIDISDDNNFGGAVVDMLRSARTRQRFAAELPILPAHIRSTAGPLADLLGNQLLQYLLSDEHRRALSSVFDSGPEHLAGALKAAGDSNLWTIACVAAARAWLDPQRSRAWADALLAADERSNEYVFSALPMAAPSASNDLAPLAEAEPHSPPAEEPTDEQYTDLSALCQLLARYDQWTASMPLYELERALGLLEAVAEPPRAACRELAGAQARLHAQLDAVPEHPVFQHLRPSLGAALQRSASLVSLLAELERRSAVLANTQQAVDRIDELCKRLGVPSSLPALPGLDDSAHAGHDALLELLSRHGDDLQGALARVDAEETAADELLTIWSQVDIGGQPPDLAGLSPALRLLLAGKLRTARRDRLAAVLADPPLVAAILAFLALRDRTAACSLLIDAARGLEPELLTRLLAILDDGCLHELAVDQSLPAELCERLFVLALASGRPDLLEDLGSHFRADIAVVELFAAVRRQFHTHDVRIVMQQIVQLARATAAAPDADPRTRTLRQQLLDRLNLPPGMQRLHAELRSHMQIVLRRTILADIEADRPTAALLAWDALGTREDMVDAAVGRLDSASARNVTEIHRKNTRTFIAEVERNLRDWAATTTPVSVGNPLEPAIRQLAAAGRSRSEAFLQTLRVLDDQPVIAPLLASPSTNLADPADHVEPIHVASYITWCSGKPVPSELYVADRLRLALGGGPASVSNAVEEFLRRRAFRAARSAAADVPELVARVEAFSVQRRDGLLREHEAVLTEARGVGADSDAIAANLQLFDEAVTAEDFGNAEELAIELADELSRHRLLQDPERRHSLEFLQDAGQPSDAFAPLETLLQRVDTLRAAHADQRLHLQFLSDASEDPAIGEYVKPQFAPLVRRLDRPSRWPSARLSVALADSIDKACMYLRTWSEYRADQPETVGQLLDVLPRYIAECLQADPPPDRDPFADLVNLTSRAHPPARVLQLIAPPRLPDAEAVRPPASPLARPLVSVQRETSGDELAGHIHRYIARVVEQTPPLDAPGDLESALRAKDWPALRRLAADRVRVYGSSPSGRRDRLTVLEGLFAFACARMSLAGPHSTRDVTLIYNLVATFWSRSGLLQYDLAGELDQLLVEALTGGERGEFGQRVAEWLRNFGGARRDDPTYTWATELMWAASQVIDHDIPASARIAEALWDLLKHQNSPHPRTDLLHWLYRLRSDEALRHLANRSPNPAFAVQCIHAFTRAESDVDVRARALQMSAAFREQALRRKNRQPWILLFLRLEQTSVHVDGDARPINLEVLDRMVADLGNGYFEVSLLVDPRLSADPPEALALRFSDNQAVDLISGDEDLLSARTIQARIPIPPRTRAGDLLEVPYKVDGRTFSGRTIDVRGTLSLELAGEVAVSPLCRDEILGAWPGASGKPVQHNEGFFGRDNEIREIDRRLRDDRGSGSLMLFGQRRIGKTSLLLEMVRLLPPRPGHVTGVFLDVSSLDLPDNMSMSQRFFEAIVQALGDPRNAAVRDQFDVNDRQMHRLFRGINPGLSLYTALHSLLSRLGEASRGMISRLAFFVDEFDRFVEPLLLGRDVQVDRLMWDLRQIVLQSRHIALVLAGSGLQKMLTREYSRPLHGSIEHVEIRPFAWERDRNAILDTFLPESIRGRLCRAENIDVVARHAATMCGGHPYFLALVGKAAGLSARGRSLNVPLLNEAARLLVDANLPELLRIDEQVFYSHIFETLKRVPLRERMIAQILLVHIAIRTTEAARWLNLGDALDVPDLLRVTREAEREAALRVLLDEGAVAQDGGQLLRITVPVTALALRRGATRLRNEAIQQLTLPHGGSP